MICPSLLSHCQHLLEETEENHENLVYQVSDLRTFIHKAEVLTTEVQCLVLPSCFNIFVGTCGIMLICHFMEGLEHIFSVCKICWRGGLFFNDRYVESEYS
jgi:hypothetical protein